jgi:hypothetical protein
MAQWSEAAVAGVLADSSVHYNRTAQGQTTPTQYRVPLNFFTMTLTIDVQNIAGPAAGGAAYTDFRSRIMNALGSTPNRGVMSLVRHQMNIYKEQVSFLLPGTPAHLEPQSSS